MGQILVVDDSSTVREEVAKFLKSQGLDVDTAVDGNDALDHIHKHRYKLIMCDINMPNMDGLTMAEKAKVKGNTAPIIMLTTESSPSMKQRGKDAGVIGWIVKPFNGPAAITGIKKIIGA